MVMVYIDPEFQKLFSKIMDVVLKEKIIKQINKLKENPEVGKPMRFGRKGSRELYISPFRLSYVHNREEDCIMILDLFHKDMQ